MQGCACEGCGCRVVGVKTGSRVVGVKTAGAGLCMCKVYTSLVPRLLFAERENSLVNCLYCLVPIFFETTMMLRQLDCEFKNPLVN